MTVVIRSPLSWADAGTVRWLTVGDMIDVPPTVGVVWCARGWAELVPEVTPVSARERVVETVPETGTRRRR